jgi:hypothetical protein
LTGESGRPETGETFDVGHTYKASGPVISGNIKYYYTYM